MYIQNNTIKSSDLRKYTAEVMEEVQAHPGPITVFSHSKPKMMVMSLDAYERLINSTNEVQIDPEAMRNAMEFLINPPKELLIHGSDPVELIRNER